MTRRTQDSIATDLAAALRERAADVGGEDDLYQRIMAVASASPQPRRFARWSFSGKLPTMTMPARLVAASVVVVLAVGLLYVNRFDRSAVGVPSPTPSAEPTEPAVVGPSATPTATPSPTPAPISWTEASLKEDWPAPVRTEPAGGASVERLQEEDEVIPDPLGDTGSDAYPWVDIRDAGFCFSGCVGMHLVSNQPPVVHPTEQWVAYGVVTDDDGDGVADRRIGMDNIPHAADQLHYRAWTTDLHTGRTIVGWDSTRTINDSWYPPTSYRADADFRFGGQSLAGGGSVKVTIPERFYVWASVIQGGRVVATDYAPDVGWLAPLFTPEVESSPSPSPAPEPTPQVEDDPDVPGGRLWTTSVVNNSPDPAKLFVAEDDESGRMGRLVGRVTPSVVPAGTTMKVTFALPPEGSRGWAIFVNPGPKQGGLNWQDVPAYGEYRIQADGTSGWRSLIP